LERSNHNERTGKTGTGKQGTLYPPTVSKEDRELFELILIPLWEEWQDELIESGEDGETPAKVFSEYSGAGENSPYSLMFLAFCGGIDKGMKLLDIMNRPPERNLDDGTNSF